MGNFWGRIRFPTTWVNVLRVKTQYVPTGGEKNYYSQAGLTRVSATLSKTYWRTRWDQGMEETVTALPERGCSTGGKYFLCISKKPATNIDKAAQRLPATEEECKGKNQILKSHWNGIFPTISINKDFTAIYGSGPPNGNFSTQRAPKRKNNPCDIAADTTLLTDRSEGVGSWGCENAGLLAPDSWGACERNEFSESRHLHLPRHACVPAKSHQSYPTLCNSMDCSLPRVFCPWDSPGKNTAVGCHALFSHT